MKVDINRPCRVSRRWVVAGARRPGHRARCGWVWLAALGASGALAQTPAPDLAGLREIMAQAAQHPEQLDFLRREAERLQVCFAKIDPQARETLQRQAQQMSGQVRALCTEGLRAEAQTQAIEGARTLLAAPAARELQQCGDTLPQLLTALPLLAATRANGANVCDLDF